MEAEFETSIGTPPHDGESGLQVVVADSDELQQVCFRLRYEVYAENRGWEGENPNRKETDPFDQYSEHALVFIDGLAVATVRVVFNQGGPLPCHLLCGGETSASAEISRFAYARQLLPTYRRDVITFLLKASVALCRERQATTVAAFMEPALIRRLRVLGVCPESVQEPITFKGQPRVLCAMAVSDLAYAVEKIQVH